MVATSGDTADYAGTFYAIRHRMGHRTFVDADGVTWKVWDVHPQLAERRRSARRSAPARLGAIARVLRAGIDRRRRTEVRIPVREGYEHGWLAFDSTVGSRRLAPIPPGWETLPDSRLLDFWMQGKDATRTRRRLIE